MAVGVFLDRLQSGFLVFGTAQGLVRGDPSFWQRVYLLWTFRNFRRLSIPLLNSRQRELVYALYRDGAGPVSPLHNPWLAIGVVENFVPPPMQIGASPAPKKERPKVVAPLAEVARKLGAVLWSTSRAAWSRLGTTLGVLSLCVISAASWRGIAGMPRSQPQNQARLQQISVPLPPSPLRPEKPAAVAESPTTIAPPATASLPLAASNVAVKSASITAVIPTLKQEIRTQAAASTPKQEARTQAAASTPDQETRTQAAASILSLPLSGQDSLIPATRPPLHFVYPMYADVRTRGVVALAAQVDSNGAVRGVRVVSGNRALAAAAARAVRQWRYRPYLKDGQPVATETNIAISFISDDAISMSFPPSLPASR